MNYWRIIQGDTIAGMSKLEPESVHCCITSPPYWGLRDYDVEGQIGLESTPEEHMARLVEVFREVRRVLRPDGTLWLNYGDAYSGGGRGGHPGNKSGLEGSLEGPDQSRTAKRKMTASRRRDDAPVPRSDVKVPGLRAKNLIGLPWMLAFALRADGWYLRQDIIWHKPNAMPESVRDRCTKAHEYLFMLSKSPRYYYDAAAIMEPASVLTNARVAAAKGSLAMPPIGGKKHLANGNPTYSGNRPNFKVKNNQSFIEGISRSVVAERNKRTVWSIPTQPTRGDHYASFPEALVWPCIAAGSPKDGTVLDPFSGTGTTGVVALKQGRNYVGCELNPKDVRASRQRLAEVAPLLAIEKGSHDSPEPNESRGVQSPQPEGGSPA